MTTVPQAIEAHLDSFAKANTRRTNGYNLGFFVRACHLEKTDLKDLKEDYIADLIKYMQKAEYKPAYIMKVVGDAARFYAYLEFERDKYELRINIARINIFRKRLQKPGLRYPVVSEEVEAVEKVLDYAETAREPVIQLAENTRIKIDEVTWHRGRAIVLTFGDTGLRNEELRHLHVKDIKEKDGVIKSRVIGKGDKEAIVRFSSRCWKAINDYHNCLPGHWKPGSFVFESHTLRHNKSPKTSHPIRQNHSINRIIFKWVKDAGILEALGVTAHTFRHDFVTQVLRNSGNLKLASELARHKSVKSTDRYAHVTTDELDKAYYDAIEAPKKKAKKWKKPPMLKPGECDKCQQKGGHLPNCPKFKP